MDGAAAAALPGISPSCSARLLSDQAVAAGGVERSWGDETIPQSNQILWGLPAASATAPNAASAPPPAITV